MEVGFLPSKYGIESPALRVKEGCPKDMRGATAISGRETTDQCVFVSSARGTSNTIKRNILTTGCTRTYVEKGFISVSS